MKSPFPGMDPYLEQYWRDVHHRLCTYACDALQPQIRPALVARIEERLVVEAGPDRERSIYPDVKVTQRQPDRDITGGGTAVAVAAEPLVIEFLTESEPATEGFIQIIDPSTGATLVTVIEFLSPSNRLPGEGQALYTQKQRELREAGVSLVEIDLIRTGDWILQIPGNRVPERHRTIYRVCVRRGWVARSVEYYPIPLNAALPTIRIPLRQQDKDATLNLQALLEQTYENGAYEFIDYRAPLHPPLDPEGAAWVDERLRAVGKR